MSQGWFFLPMSEAFPWWLKNILNNPFNWWFKLGFVLCDLLTIMEQCAHSTMLPIQFLSYKMT